MTFIDKINKMIDISKQECSCDGDYDINKMYKEDVFCNSCKAKRFIKFTEIKLDYDFILMKLKKIKMKKKNIL